MVDIFDVNGQKMDGYVLSQLRISNHLRRLEVRKVWKEDEEPVPELMRVIGPVPNCMLETWVKEGLWSVDLADQRKYLENNGIIRITLSGVGFRDALRLVGMASDLVELRLEHMTLPTLAWIPQSVKLLDIYDCVVEKWGGGGGCLPSVKRLAIKSCGLTSIPPGINKMFPSVISADFSMNDIATMGGVAFPPKMKMLVMDNNSDDLTVAGAEFPRSLIALSFAGCHGLKGFHVMKFPPRLEFLDASSCGLRWIGEHVIVPSTLTDVCLSGNGMADLRPFKAVFVGSPGEDNYRNSMNYYSHDDSVNAMLRKGVLPYDLLRTLRTEYLPFFS